MSKPAKNHSLYLPDELVRQVDEYAARLSEREDGIRVPRSQAVVVLLKRALEAKNGDGDAGE